MGFPESIKVKTFTNSKKERKILIFYYGENAVSMNELKLSSSKFK